MQKRKEVMERIPDPIPGETMGWLDHDTGELCQNKVVECPEGTILITPAQQRRNKAYWAMKEENEATKWRRERERKNGGNYYFLAADTRYRDLSPETVVRLVYLGTFQKFGKGILMLTERTPMKLQDLRDVLNISPASVTKFKEETIKAGRYLGVNADGSLTLSPDFFHRGKIGKGWYHREYQTVFHDSVRSLYNRTSPRNHGRLGLIFQMLPFINREHNILCHNPEETDINKIIPLTIDEFCGEIGYNPNQRSRLMREYSRITFDVNGTQERFCSFCFDGAHRGAIRIIINPRILYKGSYADRVGEYGTLFIEPEAS